MIVKKNTKLRKTKKFYKLLYIRIMITAIATVVDSFSDEAV